jgi:hypothetical protein
METPRSYLRECEIVIPLMRTNPILSGLVLTDNCFSYLNVANYPLWMTSRFRLSSHIYSALRDRELLEEIAFVEDAIEVYETTLFKPSRDEVAHGAFMRSYLLSANMSDAAIDTKLNRRPAPPEKFASRGPDRLTLGEVVDLFPLIATKHLSVLGPEFARARSWKFLVMMLDVLTTEEMGLSRVLSRDML